MNFLFHIKEKLHSWKENKNRCTIYHCCIQKSASQWFAFFWNDETVRQYSQLRYYNPSENFQMRTKESNRKLRKLPQNCIVSPLFIRYPDFETLKKPRNHKTFFVARDPRDVIVSSYYSIRFSHPPNEQINKMREELKPLSNEDYMTYFIKISESGYFLILKEWIQAYEESGGFEWFKYEDLFGPDQLKHFKHLMEYLEFEISKDELQHVLSENTFENVSGHAQGQENIYHHYRKGCPKDWVNHFTEEHKQLIKELTGDLLIRLGYEKDHNW